MTRNPLELMMAVVLLLAVSANEAVVAQGGPPPNPPVERPRGGAGRGAVMRGGDQRLPEAQRQEMERRLQDRIDQVVRKRLALSDEQFVKMREVASRIEGERRALRNDEMSTRLAMRRELFAGENADENRVNELLEEMTRLERRRVDLQEREQRDLAKFLSATQRARYIGVQDELRRGMQDVQRRRMDGDSASAAMPRPQGRRFPRPPGSR